MARRRTSRTVSLDLTKLLTTSPWPTLEAFIAQGGNVTLGRVEPIEYAAIASDNFDILVALQRRKNESLMNLMQRLDAGINKAFTTGEFTDEVNGR